MIGLALQVYMGIAKVSCAQLAAYLGVDVRTVNKWLADESAPSGELVRDICKILHITPNMLYVYGTDLEKSLKSLKDLEYPVVRETIDLAVSFYHAKVLGEKTNEEG